ncbi:hypothetical protein Atc_2095 [Acidithiobacillus caldus SM-1]|uniref:Uncharacterized protein n=1 Tax=Acidithiobacillus caldus (strain SM-1) TaxID=990288 RepID=F9ZRV9_ACICS|nr:hypothetical protein Atc_2095 [Acidithiobacillus caldus SM-1]
MLRGNPFTERFDHGRIPATDIAR